MAPADGLLATAPAGISDNPPSALYATWNWPNTPDGLTMLIISDTGVVRALSISTLGGGFGTTNSKVRKGV